MILPKIGFKKYSLYLIMLLCILASTNLIAQEKPNGREQQKKELRKKKEVQIEKQKKAELQLKKRHLEIQDKQTRKRMKQAKRESDKLNRSKRRR